MLDGKKKNKTFAIIEYLLGAILAAYLGFFITAGMAPGRTIFDWYKVMSEKVLPLMSKHAYGFRGLECYEVCLNQYTVGTILVSEIIYILLLLVYITGKRNYISGKEYGTSKYANVSFVNKTLSDKNTPPDKIYHGIQIKRSWLLFKKKIPFEVNMMNRQISEHISMTLNTRQTDLNNNILVVGGSGAGKTYKLAKPILLTMTSSFIITDPKGEILRDTGQFYENHGWNVLALNLLNKEGMQKSVRYNPFRYIRNETDVIKLVTNIIANTTPKDSTTNDPFWPNADSLLIQALIYYVLEVYKNEPKKKNFRTFMKLLAMAEFKIDPNTGEKESSELDILFEDLERRENRRIQNEERQGNSLPKPMSPAVIAYNSVMRGAADTVRSIIVSVNARLKNLKTDEILELLSDDEINIPEIGAGVNFDKKTKTVLYCVIPDNDKSYNFIIGMLYTQIFQELYYQADFVFGGKLPVHVTFLLDEFANVALPDDYCSLLSTMRSREISSIIIIQNFAQIKALFKDTWETIPGNCDTLIYLGGNEQSTHEYISKSFGKGTFDKKTSGETKGRQGSSSQNYDVVGRELLLPEEVRKLNKKKCLILIRGFDPIIDEKINPQKHPLYKEIDGPKYVFDASNKRRSNGLTFVGREAYESLKRQEQVENKIKVIEIDGDALLGITSEVIESYEGFETTDVEDYLTDEFLNANAERLEKEAEKEQKQKQEKIGINELDQFACYKDGVKKVLKLRELGYSDGQIRAVTPLLKMEMSVVEIKSMFAIDMEPEEITGYVTYLV